MSAHDLLANPAAFLQIGFPGPHPPYDPVPRYAEPLIANANCRSAGSRWTISDTIIRVPMLIWANGLSEGGREEAALCQQMDVGLVLSELAGAEVDPVLEAESILPALQRRVLA